MKTNNTTRQPSLSSYKYSVIEELTVKGMTLGIVYGSIFVFFEFISNILRHFESIFSKDPVTALPHILDLHYGVIMGVFITLGTCAGLGLGVAAKIWEYRNPEALQNTPHDHSKDNPYRKLFNSLSVFLQAISKRFHFLKSHNPRRNITEDLSLEDLEAGTSNSSDTTVSMSDLTTARDVEARPFQSQSAPVIGYGTLNDHVPFLARGFGYPEAEWTEDARSSAHHPVKSTDHTGSVWLHTREFDDIEAGSQKTGQASRPKKCQR